MKRLSTHAAPSRLARWLRCGERLLLTCAVTCLSIYAVACVQASLYQSEEQRAFERALSLALAAEDHDQREWSRERILRFEARRELVEAIGRLEVPDAEVSVMVLEGTDEGTLDRAVGRIEGTAQPGELGNMGIAGHRDSFFRGLRKLEVGDEIVFTSLEGRSHFEVTQLQVVKPEAVEVLDPTEQPTLTLVTCYPFYFVGDAPSRYIVSARRVRYEAWAPPDGPATASSVLARR